MRDKDTSEVGDTDADTDTDTDTDTDKERERQKERELWAESADSVGVVSLCFGNNCHFYREAR